MNEPQRPPGLGWFLGVFTPTILTILGVIMYMRLGWVVSQAGLWGTLGIVVISNTITLLTCLSMSTLATNMRVGVGGAYFLISRSFGLEVGGAIGIPLYLSQVLSLTMYAYGLAESFRIVWDGVPVQVLAALIVLGVTAVAAKSTELTLKLQLPIMGLIAMSLVAFLAGVDLDHSRVPDLGPWDEAGFWQVFAVFFPAVTGVLTGLSLSGDLADPSRSIPRGALIATVTGFVIYLVLPVALAFGASPSDLKHSLVWTQIAVGGGSFVLLGLWGAIASSAFGSILSAPRTLQALATDHLVPVKLAEVDKESGEPVLGLRISGLIAFVAVIVLPDLNAVASIVTIFFLTTYGALNVVAALEGLIGDTSFRPTLRVHWGFSLLGALGCIIAMFAINAWACLLAILVEAGIFWYLSRRSLQSTWGDARSGLFLSGARYALMRLRDARVDPRNWRPHILVFTSDLLRTIPVVRWADAIGQHRGIVTVVHLVVGDLDDFDGGENLLRTDDAMLESAGITAFCEITAVNDLDQGALTVAQANGMAGLHSNTVMLGYHQSEDGPDHLARLFRLCQGLWRLEKCTIVHCPALPGFERDRSQKPRLVVWWAGRENNGDLMLLLAHLVTMTREWRNATIELKTIVGDGPSAREQQKDFAGMLPSIRIDVDVDVVVRGADESVHDIIQRDSAGAALVFLGMKVPPRGEEGPYAETLDALLRKLPDTLLVHNAGPFRGRLV
ncbi:MAG: Na-K-Cl cotransporter [Myxococcota bacterium]